MSSKCIFIKVSGQVQQVGFRQAVFKMAQQMNLEGWVKNKANGDVDIFACGDKNNLQELLDFSCQGPEGAEVESAEFKWYKYRDEGKGKVFEIR